MDALYNTGKIVLISPHIDIKSDMFANARGQLDLAEVFSPRDRYFRQGGAVISALLEKEPISLDEYWALAGRETGDKLLEANIFSISY